MSRFVACLLICLAANLARPQEGRFPITAARGGAVVLARTVEVREGVPGEAWNQVSERGREVRQWDHLVLERVDTFLGTAPSRFVVAVPSQEVALSNFFANPKTGGYSGPGPLAGLQVGDVAIWTLQRPGGDRRYIDYGGSLVAPSESRDENVFTAPGADFALADRSSPPFLVSGRTLSVPVRVTMPEYDRKLAPALRYADLVAGATIQRLSAVREVSLAGALELLEKIPETMRPVPGVPTVIARKDLDEWFKSRLISKWPKDDASQLNLLALELHWGFSEAEPAYLAMLKRVGRRSMVADLPPVKSEAYFVETAEDPSPLVAREGFEYGRRAKCRDHRMLRAAIKWLDSASRASDDAVMREARSAGLIGTVVWYIADTADDRSFAVAPDYRGHTAAQISAARRVAERLLKFRFYARLGEPPKRRGLLSVDDRQEPFPTQNPRASPNGLEFQLERCVAVDLEVLDPNRVLAGGEPHAPRVQGRPLILPSVLNQRSAIQPDPRAVVGGEVDLVLAGGHGERSLA
jgi:hypothetical protein